MSDFSEKPVVDDLFIYFYIPVYHILFFKCKSLFFIKKYIDA